MNTQACKLIYGALAICALLLTGAPQSARAEYLTNTACSVAPPAQPILLSPQNGANGVPLMGNWVEIAVPVPRGGPAIEEQRVVLSDGTPYANDGGTLQLDTSGYLGPPNVNLDSMEIAKAWLPPLRPNTTYTVRLQLPNQGNCLYATLGSFTSGPPE
jgi:hypothetical protein